MNNSKTLPVRKWLMSLEAIADEGLAVEAWQAVVRAQGWSPVGVPAVINRPQFAEFGVVGRVVQHPGLTVASNATSIQLPA